MSTLLLTPPPPEQPDGNAHVEVWFGEHKIAEWDGPPHRAASIAQGWNRRFAGLPITTSPGVEW